MIESYRKKGFPAGVMNHQCPSRCATVKYFFVAASEILLGELFSDCSLHEPRYKLLTNAVKENKNRRLLTLAVDIFVMLEWK